jgi:hypothetical protein
MPVGKTGRVGAMGGFARAGARLGRENVCLERNESNGTDGTRMPAANIPISTACRVWAAWVRVSASRVRRRVCCWASSRAVSGAGGGLCGEVAGRDCRLFRATFQSFRFYKNKHPISRVPYAASRNCSWFVLPEGGFLSYRPAASIIIFLVTRPMILHSSPAHDS